MTKRGVLAGVVVALMVMVAAPPAEAGSNVQSAGNFGVGVQFGYPGNGLSLNWFMTQSTSLQIDASVWLGDHWTGLGGRVDYLWWMPKLANWSWGDLGWYWGPGVSLFSFSWDGPGENDGYFWLGVELPVGIGLQFAKVPIDVNLEAVPILGILGSGGTDIDFDIAGVLNARYYF